MPRDPRSGGEAQRRAAEGDGGTDAAGRGPYSCIRLVQGPPGARPHTSITVLTDDRRAYGRDSRALVSLDRGSAACAAQVLLALASYGVVAFLFNLLDEVRPIFASAPIEDGGLSMPTHLLSWPLSFGGLSFILFVCLGAHPLTSPPSTAASWAPHRAPLSACTTF